MKTFTTLRFDRMEQDILKRATPALRVAFPTEGLDGRKYEARWVLNASRGERMDYDAVHSATWAMERLCEVLEEQSQREYWEKALTPTEPRQEVIAINAVSIIAPGTDVVGVLAETRAAMRRDCTEALHLLRQATVTIGSPPEDEE